MLQKATKKITSDNPITKQERSKVKARKTFKNHVFGLLIIVTNAAEQELLS